MPSPVLSVLCTLTRQKTKKTPHLHCMTILWPLFHSWENWGNLPKVTSLSGRAGIWTWEPVLELISQEVPTGAAAAARMLRGDGAGSASRQKGITRAHVLALCSLPSVSLMVLDSPCGLPVFDQLPCYSSSHVVTTVYPTGLMNDWWQMRKILVPAFQHCNCLPIFKMTLVLFIIERLPVVHPPLPKSFL